MNALALTQTRTLSRNDGLARSARLMRALGPEAADIWAELEPHEARALTEAMDQLGEDPDGEAEAARSFVEAHKRLGAVQNRDVPIWTKLSALDTELLVTLLAAEHPQTVALILSHLHGDAAARLLRALSPGLAIDAMHRLLHIGAVHPAARKALETRLAGMIEGLAGQGGRGGHERVARIFDRLDSRSEQMFLAALENAEPGAGEKVRALMFTFDDLAGLDAGGLQTLLSAADRNALIVALKGARESVAEAFYANMTKRAGDLLREEIAALGAVRRSEVEACRLELVTLARTLIHRGDIRAGESAEDDELVE